MNVQKTPWCSSMLVPGLLSNLQHTWFSKIIMVFSVLQERNSMSASKLLASLRKSGLRVPNTVKSGLFIPPQPPPHRIHSSNSCRCHFEARLFQQRHLSCRSASINCFGINDNLISLATSIVLNVLKRPNVDFSKRHFLHSILETP